jgi:hypothetical protein
MTRHRQSERIRSIKVNLKGETLQYSQVATCPMHDMNTLPVFWGTNNAEHVE